MSSKRRIRRRSCESKKAHDEIGSAIGHAKRLGWPWHPYRCKFCKKYHVGRFSERAIRSMKKRK